MRLVKDYMMRTLNSVDQEDSLEDVISIMHQAEMSVYPVVDQENKFLGTIYSKNILKNIVPEKYGFLDSNHILLEINQAAENLAEIRKRKVKEYMSFNIKPVLESDRMDKVADVMLDNKESILFVVNDTGHLRGYLSRADVLYFLLEMSKGYEQ